MTLSGGERQRACIARALMASPPVLLADEPTAALDSRQSREIFALLARETRRNNLATLVVTHDAGQLDLADNVKHLSAGTVRRSAPPVPDKCGEAWATRPAVRGLRPQRAAGRR